MTTMPSPTLATQTSLGTGATWHLRRNSPNDYHAGPGISKSDLNRLLQSPAHWRQGIVKETPDKRLGTAAHCCVLEPESWEVRYRCIDKRNKKTPDDGKIALPPQAWETCLAIREAVWNHPTCQTLFMEGQAERSVYWIDPATLLLCKARPDWSRPGMLVDLKTTTDASPAGFARAIRKYRYHLQAAFYLDGWEAAGGDPVEEFIFIAVEKTPPITKDTVGLYRLSEATLMTGRQLYDDALHQFNDCLTRQTWPGYSEAVVTLDVI